MIRKHFQKYSKAEKEKIRWRSHEPARIEAFSDAVFAFAVSLIIISLDVPKSSKELLISMRGFLPFSFCFAFVFMVWYFQYKFFRRYGLHDLFTILLNAALLFVVLFYVFPLKFMASAVMISAHTDYQIQNEDITTLFCVYNGGFTGIFFLFTLMYLNAYWKRVELVLTIAEVFETKTHIYRFLYCVSVGVTAYIFGSLGGKFIAYSGFSYGLMGGIGFIGAFRSMKFHKKFGKIAMIEPHLGTEG